MDDIFTNATQRQQQLYEQLATCPVDEITGVVSARGVGAAKSRGDELWSLLMTFDAWRVGSSSIRTESLTVRCKVFEEELRALQNRIDAETVIKIRARVSDENVFGSPQALMEKFIERNTCDSELHDYLAQLQKPVTHQNGFFGTLTLDRRPSWYTTGTSWNGEPIDLNLSVEGPEELDATLEAARALWDDEAAWNHRIQDYAVQQLLPLKNENWLDEDEAELTAEQFKSRMRLEAVTVYPDGSFEFWHDDGDLFWGHSIQISGSLSDGPTNADIPG